MSMLQKTLLDFPQLARFASVGVINSLIGYSVIITALYFGAGDILSNMLGYAVGLSIGFVLNKFWAFSEKKGYHRLSLPPFLLIFGIAYGANLLIVSTALKMGIVENPFTHLIAMATYSGVFYLGLITATSHRDQPTHALAVLKKYWPEAVVTLGIITSLFLLINIPLSHDVVWQSWVARQMLGGAELFQDILELNPPLWFWWAMPPEWLAQFSALSSKQTIILSVFTYAGLAMVAFCATLECANPLQRLTVLGSTAIVMLLIALPDFGQREHLALIAAIPYAALIARRVEQRPTPVLIALCVAAVAAPGIALKHYFVLIPLILEVWLLFSLRKNYRPLRPETFVLGICAIIYVGLIYLLAPGFFETIVPMVQLAYHGYEIPLWMLFIRPQILLWLGGILIFCTLPGRTKSSAIAYLLISIAFMLAYFLQQKGWRYHSIPATGAMLLALVTAVNRPEEKLVENLKFATTALLVVFGLQITVLVGPYNNNKREPIAALLANTPPYSTVMTISSNPSSIWPMVDDMNFTWPSRYFSHWMLAAISLDKDIDGTLSPQMLALADDIRTETADDLWCNPPEIIMIDDHSANYQITIDVVDFFSENTRFAELFSHYARGDKQSRYTAFVKDPDWHPQQPASCREIY